MIVGICKLDLRIMGCRSLKEKRQVLRRIKDRTRASFGIAVSETDFQDLWQRAELGFAVVGNDRKIIEGILQKVVNFVADFGEAQILNEYKEIIPV